MKQPDTDVARLWTLGFRPFFALGCVSGALTVLIWIWARQTGVTEFGAFPSIWWHAHEMVYGFSAAVVIGFLATASANWSGLPALCGTPLKALAALWVAGRVAMIVPGLPPLLVAVIDVAFLPAAAVLLLRHFQPRAQRKNRMFLVLLCLWGAGNAAMHLGVGGWLPGIERAASHWGLHLVIIMITLIGGRVIPFFSSRVVPGYKGKKSAKLDIAAPAATLVFALLAAFLDEGHVATCIAAGVASLLQAFRLALWWDRKIWRLPILWILYVGYAWIPVGLALIAAAPWVGSAGSAGLHALAAGAIGTMIVAMVSRVSLGHTGRPIVADGAIKAAYAAVLAGGVVRVFGPFAAAQWQVFTYDQVVLLSGILWAAAPTLIFVRFITIWLGPRATLPTAS